MQLLLLGLGDFELAEVAAALLLGLEAAVAELGRGVDPLKVDLFGGDPPLVDVDSLPKGPLEEVVVNVTVPSEAHRVDRLLSKIDWG